MGKHISFVSSTPGAVAVAALALVVAACASAPPEEQVYEFAPAPAEAVPEEPALEADELAVEPVGEEPAAADTGSVQLKTEAPLRYVVKKGDTLWDISGYYLKDPWQWPELWYANPQVENPHLIYPGDELLLVWVDGAPRLTRAPARPDEPKPRVATPPPPGGVTKLQPGARELPLEEAIYTIPIEAIRAFLRSPRVISKDSLDDAPYVIDFEEDHVIAGADSIAYVLNLTDRRTVKYQIIRLGQEYRDPDDGDVIGYEAIPVADTVVRVHGEPATVYLTRSYIETRVGDHLLPADEAEANARFTPRPPPRRVDGRIISVFNGFSQIGQFQVVALNRGKQHGLEPGHVLSIVQAGRTAKDPKSWYGRSVKLPDIRAGEVMVFKAEPRLSYALVMSATRAVHINDRVEKPDLR